mmetsp:Transcript_14190/g.21560  ORF Transcript_14190/g.21560 Transcript_14190/m.21560 type:complete len:699 (+) Transcript_14190:114-2210(+)|eukprot:CAMPEP_0167749864 /NCGR_PEP_ID=MMETSP0110_2-20121227/5658_1 /TAXON_ID=629695 /ORGANISM="Gymnochlora sp., Strain CCMP2014" /LENGTH=698 /DNA_ID=CAMNT_0007635093 /DNA_START=48 /DNA_END=2144 /DNA_ORIENTATION=+
MEQKTFSVELDASDLGKQAWIEKAMQDRRQEWTEAKDLTVFCGTWNVNGKKPKENISTWLMPADCKGKLPDLYCLGFQEVVDLNAQSLAFDHKMSEEWEAHIENTTIGSKKFGKEYYLVKTVHLVGLLMLVYTRRTLRNEVSSVDAAVTGVGILGVGGNKGAVVVRLNIYDSSLCFVNTHLAAHKNNVEGRNADYFSILKKTRVTSKRQEEMIGAQHYSFWIGDLNYRLTCTDLTEVYRDIEDGNIGRLLRCDQLILEKKNGKAFKGWEEGDITFLPTYKYITGTDRYDNREDKKKRFPAWCDRIQWRWDKKVKGTDIKLAWYRRAEQKQSDHKPVMAWFDVTAQKVVKKSKAKVLQSITRQFDAWENDQIPQVALNRNHVNFHEVVFERPHTEIVVVKNIGKSVAEYYFASGAGNGAREATKNWLSVEPSSGYIPPGRSIHLKITVHVNASTASVLNRQVAGNLQGMLIFRLKCGRKDELGKDYYIEVTGKYLRSCFGCSLEYLVRCPMPVRAIGPGALKVHPESVLTLPKEVWRIADYLFRKGMDEEDLFLTSGDEKQIAAIRECLDTGRGFGDFTVHSMAEAFIQFFDSLAEPVYPLSLIDNHLRSDTHLSDFCKQSLLKLSPIHYNTFVYVLSFLREVLRHSENNKLTVERLIPLFAKCLFHYTPGAAEKMQAMKQRPWMVLKNYLTNKDFVVS